MLEWKLKAELKAKKEPPATTSAAAAPFYRFYYSISFRGTEN
jgi:hypothetical protein